MLRQALRSNVGKRVEGGTQKGRGGGGGGVLRDVNTSHTS